MGRPRKHPVAAPVAKPEPVAVEPAAEVAAPAVEGADFAEKYPEAVAAEEAPLATPEYEALEVIVDRFKVEFSEEWEECRLWPTQSGLTHMIEVLGR